MPWLKDGDVACDTCGFKRGGVPDIAVSVQMLRAGGWGYFRGVNIGGEEFETIACPRCRKDEKRRPRVKESIEQDVLPLDFEEGRIVGGQQGVSSR